MSEQSITSVIMPVYNRPDYLEKAIDSVLNQTVDSWELIIADDASEKATQKILEKYAKFEQVKNYYNPKNIGLFANLNQAINKSQGNSILLLCSDDFLLPECLRKSRELLREYPESGLLLSSHETVNSENKELASSSIYYYDQFVLKSIQTLNSEESIPLLLKYGSINGNLTGMFFKRSLFEQIGGFREEWYQVSDWEWVYRAAKHSPILISKIPRVVIRSHPEQLSGINFKNFRNSLEVIEMVEILLNDPYISQLEEAHRWALHIMQLHLWYAFKFAWQGHWSEALAIAKAINQVTGFSRTLWAMIRWLPQRWQIYRQRKFPLPPA